MTYRTHRITLSNGQILLIEEGTDRIHLATEMMDQVEFYICEINTNGVLVMTNSGDAVDHLCRDLKKDKDEVPPKTYEEMFWEEVLKERRLEEHPQ